MAIQAPGGRSGIPGYFVGGGISTPCVMSGAAGGSGAFGLCYINLRQLKENSVLIKKETITYQHNYDSNVSLVNYNYKLLINDVCYAEFAYGKDGHSYIYDNNPLS